MRDPWPLLVRELENRSARFVLIGVGGAKCYVPLDQPLQLTQDRDLFLPADARNLVAAWRAAEATGLHLTTSGEPLDRPRDLWLAERIVERRELTRAIDNLGLVFGFTLVMGNFEFEQAWSGRRTFAVGGAALPVARLADIVESMSQAGRPKDLLFLETHKEALRELLEREGR